MELPGINAKLSDFISCDKFKTYQHLQPAVENSASDTVTLVNGLFNDTAKELQELIAAGKYEEQAVKDILLQTTDLIGTQELDTEDFEFCYELIFVLSDITGVSIRNEIDKKQEQAISPDALLDIMKKAGLDPKDFGL